MIEVYGVFAERCPHFSFTVFKLRRRCGELVWGFVQEFNSLNAALAKYPNAVFIERSLEEYGENPLIFPFLEDDL